MSKRTQQQVTDSSSDENSSTSPYVSFLDLLIPPPENFLGKNNPFFLEASKKKIDEPKGSGSSSSSTAYMNKENFGSGISDKNAINFSSNRAPLKNVTNLSTSNLAKAAGQPSNTVKTKQKLSATEIANGPSKEVPRRRSLRLAAIREAISTTTINPIPKNTSPIHAKSVVTNEMHRRKLRARHFGTVNRFESGEPFSIHAKRTLLNGRVEYLIEWGGEKQTAPPSLLQPNNPQMQQQLPQIGDEAPEAKPSKEI